MGSTSSNSRKYGCSRWSGSGELNKMWSRLRLKWPMPPCPGNSKNLWTRGLFLLDSRLLLEMRHHIKQTAGPSCTKKRSFTSSSLKERGEAKDNANTDDCRFHERCLPCSQSRAARWNYPHTVYIGPCGKAHEHLSREYPEAVNSLPFQLHQDWPKPAGEPHFPEGIPSGLDIVYLDESIIVVNKPSGLLSTPGRGPERIDSVATRAVEAFGSAFLGHRLDQGTSGLIVLGRSKDVERELFASFRDREVSKSYVARVTGVLPCNHGIISLPLVNDWFYRPLQKVCFENGKPSETRYEVLSSDGVTSSVRLYPITGRSHQLRVHMAVLGNYILGDDLYSTEKVGSTQRLHLHASTLNLGPRFADLQLSCPAPFEL